MNSDQITPHFDYFKVFSCQWELDSVASFLQLSVDYATATKDYDFFKKGDWSKAVETILRTAESMMMDSYDDLGNWQRTPYTYCAPYGGTPINECAGSPHKGHIGLIRSYHRPSDDACTYQYLIPSNMMFSAALNASSFIMQHITPPTSTSNLTTWMQQMSTGIRNGIEQHAVFNDPQFGKIYAYEIDGYGSANIMDDPNVPSLLSAPFLNYLAPNDPIYLNTRRKILSKSNPYYAWGPILSGVGSPHTLPGKPWPMANVMTILTSEDDEEIKENLRMLLRSTDGYGLMHESVSAQVQGVWSRQWFSWANGLFGQAVLDIEKRKPWILKESFQ
jgi:meiotically up-regulated gene 157 (Mug157) protein